MHASASVRLARFITTVTTVLLLAGCFGEGDGQQRIVNTPAPPPPPIPAGFCDPINFEDLCGAVTFNDFEGGVASIIDNPQSSGINTSAKVGQMQKFGATSGLTFGGSTLGFSDAFQVTAGSSFTMKVWAQRSVRVLFQPEPAGPGSGVELTHGGTGWEELTFDFVSFSGTVSGITLIFDNGTLGNAANDPNSWTFYFDDITLVPAGGGGGTGTTLPVDFEGDPASYDFGMDGGFGGGASDVIANPDQTGINTSAQTARMQKFAGEVFGGSTLALAGDVDFAQGEVFTMKVWATRAVPVLFKFEGLNEERSVDHSGSGSWEELCFDFSGSTGGPASSAITFIFDLGVNGDAQNDPGNWTFYYDDIQQVASCGGGGGSGFNAVTFDDPALTYTLRGFGGAEDSTLQPDPTGGSNQVVRVNRAAGAETFAGTVVSTGANESIDVIPLDATNTQMTVRVYSPAAGIQVRLKIENSLDAGVSVETEATTTVVNTWETLTFDFSNEAAGTAAFNPAATYDKVVLFFNFGTAGAPAETYYFDDIDVISGTGGGGGSSSVDFEGASYTFNDFGGGVAAVIANPDASGINTSTQVGQMQKFAGETFAGSTLDLGAAVPLADGDSYTMKVRSQRSVVVTLKLEPLNEERTATHSGSGTWEELCFDFTGVSGDVTGITLIFDNGTAGDAAGDPDNWTFQFDDIQQTSNACPSGGGGGSGFNAVTFDDPALTYTLRGFGGAEDSTLQPDPTGGSNQVVRVNRAAGAETFAGTVVSTGANESIDVIPLDATNTQMTVRVYSPAAGIQVRLKIENSLDAGVSVETEATTTVVNTWETLTFDFANEAAGTAAFNPAATYDKVVLFFNFGTAGAPAETYYFDDIDVVAGTGGGGGSGFNAVTFDDPALTYTLRGFGGAEDSTLQPDPTGGSNQVVRVNRAAGAETFAGTVVSTGANESIDVIPLDATNTQMTVRVYSPAAGIQVRLKIENSLDAGVSVETEATTTVVNTWETLTFDFSNEAAGTAAFNPAATYDKVVLFFNFGTAGAPAETYYFDDIDVISGTGGGGGGGGGVAAVDFESAGTGAGFTWTVFENDDNPPLQIIANPDTGGINSSATVARFTARLAGQPFAGVETAHGDVGPLTLDASNSIIKVMVWKSVISDVGVKFAIANGGAQPEIRVPNTVVDQWEELTFDLSAYIGRAEAIDIDQLIIFPDFQTRTTENVVYFDNVRYTDGT